MKIRSKAFVLLLAASVSLQVMGQLPAARLHSIFPPGGRAGSTVDVTLAGADLDDLAALKFSSSNITASSLGGMTFRVNIASNAAPGLYEVRAAGRFGASNPRAFEVGTLPEKVESDNGSLDKPMPIQLGMTVNARTDANAIDHYKLPAQKGQRIIARCTARELDSRTSVSLTLLDTTGRELARARRDGEIEYTPNNDGDLILKVHDSLYRGGIDFIYRLTVGSLPRVDLAWPPFTNPSASNELILLGRGFSNSPPVGTFEKLVITNSTDLVQGEPSRRMEDLKMIPFHLVATNGLSNPFLLYQTTAASTVEPLESTNQDEIIKCTLPAEVWGRFYPADDFDIYQFEAKKGDVYWVELTSHRLGCPTDPVVVVQRLARDDKGGEQLTDLQELNDQESDAGREFALSTRDPAGRVEIKEDGIYRVQVRDLFNNRTDPRLIYRLSIAREAPWFFLVASATPAIPAEKDKREVFVSAPFLRRGQSFPIKVAAVRKGGFGGDISLSVQGLPPGVSAAPAKVPAGKNTASLILSASTNAADWHGPIIIAGEAKIGDRSITNLARGSTVLWNVPDYNNEAIHSRVTEEFWLAVSGVESAPLRIVPESAPEAAADSKVKVPFTVQRSGQFGSNLKLKPAGHAQLDSVKEIEIDGKATNGVIELDLAQLKLPPGEHTFWLQTAAKGKYENNPEAAKAADAAHKEAEKAATEAAAAAKKAAETFAEAKKKAEEAESAAKTASEKDAAESAKKAAAAVEARSAAEKLSNEAAAKAKEAEDKKTAAAARAKELAEKAKPRDVNVPVYSAPLVFKVLPAAQKEKK